MNEQIKEFAKQSHNPYAENNVDLEKFAKLIIDECADYANWYQANSRYTDIAKAIREHFGIKL